MQTIQQQEQDRCTRGLLTGLLSAYFVLTEGNTRKGQDVKKTERIVGREGSCEVGRSGERGEVVVSSRGEADCCMYGVTQTRLRLHHYPLHISLFITAASQHGLEK